MNTFFGKIFWLSWILCNHLLNMADDKMADMMQSLIMLKVIWTKRCLKHLNWCQAMKKPEVDFPKKGA